MLAILRGLLATSKMTLAKALAVNRFVTLGGK